MCPLLGAQSKPIGEQGGVKGSAKESNKQGTRSSGTHSAGIHESLYYSCSFTVSTMTQQRNTSWGIRQEGADLPQGETTLPIPRVKPLPEGPHQHNLVKDDVQPLRFAVHHHQPFLLLL